MTILIDAPIEGMRFMSEVVYSCNCRSSLPVQASQTDFDQEAPLFDIQPLVSMPRAYSQTAIDDTSQASKRYPLCRCSFHHWIAVTLMF